MGAHTDTHTETRTCDFSLWTAWFHLTAWPCSSPSRVRTPRPRPFPSPLVLLPPSLHCQLGVSLASCSPSGVCCFWEAHTLILVCPLQTPIQSSEVLMPQGSILPPRRGSLGAGACVPQHPYRALRARLLKDGVGSHGTGCVVRVRGRAPGRGASRRWPASAPSCYRSHLPDGRERSALTPLRACDPSVD